MKIKLINTSMVFGILPNIPVILTKAFLGGKDEMTGNNDNTLMAIVEVPNNASYKISASGNNVVFAFLTGLPSEYMHGRKMAQYYADCDNSGRVFVSSGSSKNGSAGNANYLLVSIKSTTSWKPSEVQINGRDYLPVIETAVNNPDTPYM